ncbi:MAG: hypothetical protein IPJ88_14695 [Myxococcales bacterium]|nr:MAG: hypothetical protein IPJ88_14695 [Myxococcales bacterium]
MTNNTEQNDSEQILDATQEDSMDLAWTQVLEHWEEDIAHRRFIVLCQATGKLSEAGKRYRSIKEADPARSERASMQLEHVFAAAMQALDASRADAIKPSHNRITVFALGVFLMMLFFAVWAWRRTL